MNFWILNGRTPEKCGLWDRLVLMVREKRLGHLLKEDVLQASNGEIRIATDLVALTLDEQPRFETMARGPGTPLDVNLKAFPSRSYAEALLEHEKLVKRIKSDTYNDRR